MPMNLERLRRQLLEERENLLSQLEHKAQPPQYNIGLGNHMADDATEAFEQAKRVSLTRREQEILAKIEKALKKMDDGTYGYCERCGAPIDYARLKAIPYATLCLRCQKKIEQGM